jgi:hypothetical protein
MNLKQNYFQTLSDAIDEAFERTRAKGFTIIDSDQLWDHMYPETSQTKLYALEKDGKLSKKGLNISIYRMPSSRYN